jgi:N-acetylglutamate synthase-like GNAT family acetyltransferase
MSIQVLERDMTKPELNRMNAGFVEHGLEYGIQPFTQVRYGFVAVEGDKFIGCVSGLTSSESWFYLTDLWLEKEYRRRGLGAELLRKMEDKITEVGIRKIYTWTTGYEAPSFYKKQGYEIFCELESFFSTGHSRVGFRKTLQKK